MGCGASKKQQPQKVTKKQTRPTRSKEETKEGETKDAPRKPVEKKSVPVKEPKPAPKPVEEIKEREVTKIVTPEAPSKVRNSPDRSEGPSTPQSIASASELAAKRLGIDPALLQPRRQADLQGRRRQEVAPKAAPPRTTTTTTTTTPTKEEPAKKEEEEEEEKDDEVASTEEETPEEDVDDALARINAIFHKPEKKPRVVKEESFSEDDEDDDAASEALARISHAIAKPSPMQQQRTVSEEDHLDPGVSALFAAVERHDYRAVRELIQGSVPVDARDPTLENYTALFVAAEEGDLMTMDVLLANGADVEARDNNGRTPMYAAAVAGQAKAVAHFIYKYHANPNVRNKAGRHVFWAACGLGRVDVADAILDSSARRGVWTIDIDAKDPCGANALDFAMQRRNKKVQAFLRRHDAHESTFATVKLAVNQYELLEQDLILAS